MDRDQELARHFLAAIAYRAQKALRGAPDHYPDFAAGHRARSPAELVRHMTSLMGYVRTLFLGGSYPSPNPLPTFGGEIGRFHAMLQEVGGLLESGAPLGITLEQLLQGPFADAMTHVGQLALLRRLADAPVAPENFVYADVQGTRLGPEQPMPARPDYVWPERPVTVASLQPGVEIRRLAAPDVDAVAHAFASWPKPRSLYEGYLAEQEDDRRVVLVAWCEMGVCGYGTVVWQPDYPSFRENGIPEIQDLNVLPGFRRRGIGSALLDAAERLVASRSPVVGIGVGLYADYGAAQRLYVRRGYLPDGRGASYRNRPVLGGETVAADDDLVLHFTRRLA